MSYIKINAYGKVNLSLDVLRKREDGYHDLDMIMQSVSLHDDVEIKVYSGDGDNKISVFVKGSDNDVTNIGDAKDNICYKAAKLISDKFSVMDDIDITISKRIPVAGGMAGGSADCAAVIVGLNELLGLSLSLSEMQSIGVKLGADVPYCIMGGTARAEGIGEILTKLPMPPKCILLIAKPDVYVSTGFVYSRIRPLEIEDRPDTEGLIEAIEDGNLLGVTSRLKNVMEDVTVGDFPIITDIENVMIDNGAMTSIMSGSGPTVFGIFKDEDTAAKAAEVIKEKGLSSQICLATFANELPVIECMEKA